MNADGKCPKCGAELIIGVLEGLCVECVIKATLSDLGGDASNEENTLKPGFSSVSPPHRYFGDYELLEEIAHGGMGVVYRARQISLNRVLAVKMIRTGLLASDTELKRFRAEAEAAASLDHPNIVPLYEVGESGGRQYFSMKLIEGGTLTARIQEGCWFKKQCAAHQPLSVFAPGRTRCCTVAAAVMAKSARAVHYAHQRGILHRDLKPGNILIDDQDEPHITDFGLALRLESETHFTMTGTVLGTPSYISPEQAAGKVNQLTTATDIYSLGAILYELLTGKPPFTADTPLATMRRVMDEEPERPSSINHLTDRDLETICLKCLEKDPQRRYASAAELADELERFVRGEPIRSRRSTTPERLMKWAQRHPARAVALGAFLVLLAVSGFGITWEWQQAKAKARESEARLIRMLVANGTRSVQAGDPLQALPWFAEALRLEQGDSIRAARDRCCLANTIRGSARPVQAWFFNGRVVDAAFSPDGQRLAAASEDRTARVWDVATGEAVSPLIWLPDKPRKLLFAPDGARFAVGCDDGTVCIWDTASGKPLIPPVRHSKPITALSFNRNGGQLATASQDGSAQVWDALTGAPRTQPMWDRTAGLDGVLFSLDDRRLFTFASDDTLHLWSATTGEPLTNRPETKCYGSCAALSPDGGLLAIASEHDTVFVQEIATGKRVSAPLRHKGWIRKVVFSPDSQRVVTGSEDGTARVWEASSGRPVTEPLRHENGVVDVAFSPDGQRVLTASQDQTARLWDVTSGKPIGAPLRHGTPLTKASFNANGSLVLTLCGDGVARVWTWEASPPPTVMLRSEDVLWESWFNRDASRVITSDARGRARVWDVTTGHPLSPLLEHGKPNVAAAFSPDGNRVLMVGSSGMAHVWDAATGKVSRRNLFLGYSSQISWSPDGQRFVASHGGFQAQVFDALTGQLALLKLTGNADIEQAAFSPDGRRIVTGDQNGRVQFWNATTGQPLPLHAQHAGEIVCLEFNRSGTKLAVGSRDRTARVWDALNGAPLTPPLLHGGELSQVHFSPDQRHLLTASRDGTARVWDATTGRPITPPLVVMGLGRQWEQFSLDGRFVLTRREASVQVWDAETGVPVMPPIESDKDLVGAALSADDRRLLVLVEDGSLRSYDIAPPDWSVAEWQLAAHFLSSQTVEASDEISPWARLATDGSKTNSASSLKQDWLRLRQKLAALR